MNMSFSYAIGSPDRRIEVQFTPAEWRVFARLNEGTHLKCRKEQNRRKVRCHGVWPARWIHTLMDCDLQVWAERLTVDDLVRFRGKKEWGVVRAKIRTDSQSWPAKP